ncbi:MAG TPA: SRPBCC family protein [Vicinamibacterales bacterium]|nr:SRPBCC family protein [Vicinamibacterales bacterium]
MMASATRNSETFKVTTPSDTDVHFTRLFDAPRHLVFEAMTKPEHIRRWWGNLDAGYSVPVCEVDFRVGGKWRFVNKHPKGEAEFYGEYREIDAPGRVVFTEIFAPFPDTVSIVTAELTEENGKTRLNAVSSYPSKEVRDMVLSTGMEKGAGLSYDRLDEVAMELAKK